MKQPDNFFKTKLEGMELPVPDGAWNKIEAATRSKKKSIWWMRIAASLLLICAALGLIWKLNNQNVSVEPIAQKKTTAPTLKETPVIEKQNDERTADKKRLTADIDTLTAPKATHTFLKKQSSVDVHIETASVPSKSNESLNEEKSSDEILETKITAVDPSPADTNTSVASNFKLTIEAAEVNQKYLKKSIAEATPDIKKTSGIQKLLDKANDLKHDQDPFGELREMKNEVLALGIAANKKNEQNK